MRIDGRTDIRINGQKYFFRNPETDRLRSFGFSRFEGYLNDIDDFMKIEKFIPRSDYDKIVQICVLLVSNLRNFPKYYLNK